MPYRAVFLFKSVLTDQALVQWAEWAFYLGVKHPEREATHSPPPSVDIKNEWHYITNFHTPSWSEQGQLSD